MDSLYYIFIHFSIFYVDLIFFFLVIANIISKLFLLTFQLFSVKFFDSKFDNDNLMCYNTYVNCLKLPVQMQGIAKRKETFMPGYLLHYAAVKRKLLVNRSFMLGVESPDILKKHIKIYGIDGARCKYNGLKTLIMPNYDRFEKRALEPETIGSTTGLHYGTSSNPNIWLCWNELSEEEKNSPFFRGYIWHLLTDYIMYKRLEINQKFIESLKPFKDSPDFADFQEKVRNELHEDWNKINFKVAKAYPEIILPEEVIELDVVKYVDSGKLTYVDWAVLKSTIDFLRTFDPVNASSSEMEDIM